MLLLRQVQQMKIMIDGFVDLQIITQLQHGMGYDMNETINFDGKNPAGLIWAEIMKKTHSEIKREIIAQ